MLSWKLFRNSAAVSLAAALIPAGVAFKQWLDAPIAIMPFTVVAGAGTAGLSAAPLADQIKSHISKIYNLSGDLFETRKLGDPTLPLDVQIGSTGWNIQTLTNALGIRLTSADVTGQIAADGSGLVLQWTTVTAGGFESDSVPIPGASLANVDDALACLALRTVAKISPDVAANFLHKQDELAGRNAVGDPSGDQKSCISEGDEELYSRVSKDEERAPAVRVNALVGLSVHYSNTHQLFEELTMAEAATTLAARTLSCDDPPAQSSPWERIKCKAAAYHPFSDKNSRAEIAAWMQLGAARSDHASTARTLAAMRDMRRESIKAYEQVIRIQPGYALAYDAKGLQHSLLNEADPAQQAYATSLTMAQTSPAHVDLALLALHGRDDFRGEKQLRRDDLEFAERHFRNAIALSPDYWDAHSQLGYVLYKRGALSDAANVLEAAASHDVSNRDLRLLLGAVYAEQCRFDAAKSLYKAAYANRKRENDTAEALNTLSDWGQTLDAFGMHGAALDQELKVLDSNARHVHALQVHGEITVANAGEDSGKIEAGLAELKAAVDNDSAKTDTVLRAYLRALVRTGRAPDAIAQYESWSRDGLVPPVATGSTSDAVILPAAAQTRLIYAEALAMNRQWASAAREFSVLSLLGVQPGVRDGAEIRALAEAATPDAASLIPVVTKTTDDLTAERHADTAYPCNPSSIAQPLLEDDSSPVVTAMGQPALARNSSYPGRRP